MKKSKDLIAAANKKAKSTYGNMFSKGVSLYGDKPLPAVDKNLTIASASSITNPRVRYALPNIRRKYCIVI